LRLDDVARYAGCSPSHLSRRLTRETGRGFRELLLEMRLREGARLLSSTGLGVKEIAACVGYSATSSFDRAFRRAYGCWPSEWRRRTLVGCVEPGRTRAGHTWKAGSTPAEGLFKA
jgi:AraC-like DNA-binding protein